MIRTSYNLCVIMGWLYVGIGFINPCFHHATDSLQAPHAHCHSPCPPHPTSQIPEHLAQRVTRPCLTPFPPSSSVPAPAKVPAAATGPTPPVTPDPVLCAIPPTASSSPQSHPGSVEAAGQQARGTHVGAAPAAACPLQILPEVHALVERACARVCLPPSAQMVCSVSQGLEVSQS
jgi:hypothetical protein